MSMCSYEEKSLKNLGMSVEKQFETMDNWTTKNLDTEHASRKQVKNELNNITTIFNNLRDVLKENKLRIVFSTIVDYMGRRVYVQAIMPGLI
mmetsp:Transcript_13925/g.30168  ORF Transcript_13925/g.30168 Transcript_13925/m.30168 type:complete len:92 (+) Transcript_13925:1428-1703(+)